MAAPAGNRFWEMRSSHGRNPKFKKPADLWNAATEYFAWAEDNPLQQDKTHAYLGDVTHEPVSIMRAMTLDGLQIFLDITDDTWRNYCKREDFLAVTQAIAKVIRTQKFEGAAAGLLNPNIIARDLGLVDRSETDLKGATFVIENGPK